jgi:hypothetical protein
MRNWIGTVLSCIFLCMPMTSQSRPADSMLKTYSLLKQVHGWNLDFLNEAKIVSRSEYVFSGDKRKRVFATVGYETAPTVITLPLIQMANVGGRETVICDKVYFIPESVVAVEYKNRVFGYMLSGRLVSAPHIHAAGVGAGLSLVLYDMEGTGLFDTIRLFSGAGLPFLPDWVK